MAAPRSASTVARPRRLGRRPAALLRVGLAVFVGGLAACSTGPRSVPQPRPIITPTGARLRVEQERMNEVNDWVLREDRNIVEDPSFWLITEPAEEEEVYPWEGLRINERADSVWVKVPTRNPDPQLVFRIYAHLHLMAEMGRQEEWLPEAPTAEGYELEQAILSRAADAWILGRTVYNTSPYPPLDELAYAKEASFLDAFIFTARPDEFATERAEWARANPGETDRYRDWFLDTFNREPPGLRPD